MSRHFVSARGTRTSSSIQGGLLRTNSCNGGQVTRCAATYLDRSQTQPLSGASSFIRPPYQVRAKAATITFSSNVSPAFVPASVKKVVPLLRSSSENAAATNTNVDGLFEFLAARGLEAHFLAAVEWCRQMGAAYLDEVLENLDDLGDALGLCPQERTRLLSPEPVSSSIQIDTPATEGSKTLQHQAEIASLVRCTQPPCPQVVFEGPLRTTTIDLGSIATRSPKVNITAAGSVVMPRTRTSPTTHIEADMAKRRAEQACIPLQAWAPQKLLAAPLGYTDTGSARKLSARPQSAGAYWFEDRTDAELVEENYYMAGGEQNGEHRGVARFGWDARMLNDPRRGHVDKHLLRQQAPAAAELSHPFAQGLAKLMESKASHHKVPTFEQLRKNIWKEHGAELRDNLSNCFQGHITIEPAPVSVAVQQRFLQGYAAAPFADVVPTYHGSDAANYESICRRGLLIPGQGNELKVEHGNVHGRGVYTARMDNPSLSRGFCTEPSMLICGVVDDAVMATTTERCGRFNVSAKSQVIKHVGSAVVVADDRRVAPLFQVTADDFMTRYSNGHGGKGGEITTLGSWLSSRSHVSTTQPRRQDVSYISQSVSDVWTDPMPCGPCQHFVDIGKGQVLNVSSGEKAFMPPVAETWRYEVKQKRTYEARKRDANRAAMRSQKVLNQDAGISW